MAKASRKLEKATIAYSSGRNLAEKYYNDYSETGECELGSPEFQAYCEMAIEAVKDSIRKKKPITKNDLEDITLIKDEKNTQFYDGVYDYLLEELKKRL